MKRPIVSPALLQRLAILISLVAAAVFVWPRSQRVADGGVQRGASSEVPVASVQPGDVSSYALDSLATIVVDGNIFSATRRAPRTRFMLPSDVSPTAAALGGAMDSTSAIGQASPAEVFPRLSGIVTRDGERRALIQFSLNDGAPALYRAGDARAGYRVVRIESDIVVLATRGGRRTLRLSKRPASDSLGKQP